MWPFSCNLDGRVVCSDQSGSDKRLELRGEGDALRGKVLRRGWLLNGHLLHQLLLLGRPTLQERTHHLRMARQNLMLLK